jgi:phosphatidylethanolamine-binding protein (PEBP) family uncharacterized protein
MPAGGAAPAARRSDPASSVRSLPQFCGAATIGVTSASFAAGGPSGRRRAGTGCGNNLSPQLSWGNVPAGQGRTGYAGRVRCRGHGVHRYGFQVHALDRVLPPVSDFAGLTAALDGHVVARGLLEGTRKGRAFRATTHAQGRAR